MKISYTHFFMFIFFVFFYGVKININQVYKFEIGETHHPHLNSFIHFFLNYNLPIKLDIGGNENIEKGTTAKRCLSLYSCLDKISPHSAHHIHIPPFAKLPIIINGAFHITVTPFLSFSSNFHLRKRLKLGLFSTCRSIFFPCFFHVKHVV